LGKKLGQAIGLLALATIVLVACSSAHGQSGQVSNNTSAAGRALAARVIPAPYGYTVDTTPGAIGQITPALFATFGGSGSPSTNGFVAGYKGNYVSADTGEGISVTLLQFANESAAISYLNKTANKTLSFAAATYKPYPAIPGATEVDGTKAYAGGYDHGVVMTHGPFYAQLVYVTTAPSATPIEFKEWAEAQYNLLK
jgi:hypothetical protein